MEKLLGKITFVGAGRMATALAKGFVQSGMLAAEQIVASDTSDDTLHRFAGETTGSQTTPDNTAAIVGAEVVILAVKPQHLPGVLAELKPVLDHQSLVVSIAAGVTLAKLSQSLTEKTRIIRVMPNTPCLVGKGACGYSLGQHATTTDGELVANLLSAVGIAVETPESLLDAVTGLSGSGPAFVYTVIESLADAGVHSGLPRSTALDLAAQTVAGAAEMVIATGQHPATLRDQVTSPGGTTIAGLAELERHGLRHALAEAVGAAVRRSQELGKG